MAEPIVPGTNEDVWAFSDLYAIATHYSNIPDDLDMFDSQCFFFDYYNSIKEALHLVIKTSNTYEPDKKNHSIYNYFYDLIPCVSSYLVSRDTFLKCLKLTVLQLSLKPIDFRVRLFNRLI